MINVECYNPSLEVAVMMTGVDIDWLCSQKSVERLQQVWVGSGLEISDFSDLLKQDVT